MQRPDDPDDRDDPDEEENPDADWSAPSEPPEPPPQGPSATPEQRWSARAFPAQLAPPGDWRVWLFLGGRGAGKTRAGAEWVSALARAGAHGRIALIGATLHDVREVMIEGVSGLRSLDGERPHYEVARRRLCWSNGVEAYAFSSEDPESLRGPQFHAAWGDELAYWSHVDETLGALSHGLRLGPLPRLALTTTPRPLPALKALIARADTAVTRARTWDNAGGLSQDFLAALRERWTGSAHERQELMGELIESHEGALWSRAELEGRRVSEAPPLDRIVVAVDPPVSAGDSADACGIVAAGSYGEGLLRRAVVLADASVRGATPQQWATRAVELANHLAADVIIAEANNGGELVRTMLRLAAPDASVELVHARVDKRRRAQPVAALYAQGRVVHAGVFPLLEDEMCSFGAPGVSASPDRLDALVWAVTDLLIDRAAPRLRAL